MHCQSKLKIWYLLFWSYYGPGRFDLNRTIKGRPQYVVCRLGISEDFERYQYFNFETNFLENKNLFQKLDYRLLVKNINIENASFLYKIAIPEASYDK